MILVLQYASGSNIGMHCHDQSLRFVRVDTCCFALDSADAYWPFQYVDNPRIDM